MFNTIKFNPKGLSDSELRAELTALRQRRFAVLRELQARYSVGGFVHEVARFVAEYDRMIAECSASVLKKKGIEMHGRIEKAVEVCKDLRSRGLVVPPETMVQLEDLSRRLLKDIFGIARNAA